MPALHFRFLDLVKAVACALIVLHHLAFYGPMADHARPLWPELLDWLGEHARIAVHAFLAISGFLAAKSLSHRQLAVTKPLRAVLRRFTKLAPPFIVATALAVLASVAAARWMTHESISPMPTLGQFLAHALLLHGVLGYESLSAGAWYIAIDFQLFALLTLMLWLARRIGRSPWTAPALIAGGAATSLMIFNLNPYWDVWAPYFFGSYGLGALAWWAVDRTRGRFDACILSGLILLLGGLALNLEFRSRIAVALCTALLMVLACRGILQVPGQQSRLVAFLGRISYAVFLVHFSVCLLVNAAFTRFAPALPEVQAIGMLIAWISSVAAGAGFHRWVEMPLAALDGCVRSPLKAAHIK